MDSAECAIIAANRRDSSSFTALSWETSSDPGMCLLMVAIEEGSLGGYESRWKIEFGFEYFTGNHERRHLEEGISISFACTVYMY